jgi:hypothetical protein
VLPVVLTAAGLGFGVVFVRRQLASEQPMLDMRLFARGTFSGALLVNLLSVVSLVGFLYFVAQHLQLIVGLSPMEAGFARHGGDDRRRSSRRPDRAARLGARGRAGRADVLGRGLPARPRRGRRRRPGC